MPDQYTAVDEGEDDGAEVFGRVDAPMLENGPGHRSKAMQGETTHAVGQLLARDVPRLVKPFHDVVEGRKQKEVRFPVKAGVLFLEPVQDLLGELKLGHVGNVTSSPPWR